MRVVLDTNVIVSSIFWKGKPRKVLDLWIAGKFDLVISTEIFDEYINTISVLARKYNQINKPENILDYIIRNAIAVIPEKITPITEDPDDDKFFEAAISSSSEIIVSGDKHLLKIGKYMNIEVLTVEGFLNFLEKEPL